MSEAMLTEKGYEQAAEVILTPLEEALSSEEISLVLGSRIRTATEEFIKCRGNGRTWRNLLALMCAMQVHAGKREPRPSPPPAPPTESEAPKTE